MTAVNWTAEQKEAITYKGKNILVAAGAGSGKTTVLIERIINRLLDAENPVDIDRLLVVTYTNAAAAEMKHRLAVALQKSIAEFPNNRHLVRQLSLLQRAHITTLHSFCLDVVKKYSYLLDLDPNTKIGNETDLFMLQEDVMAEIFEKSYADENSALKLLLNLYSRGIDDNVIKDMILKTVEAANSLPKPLVWLDSLAEAYTLGDFDLWMQYIVENTREELAYYCREYESIIELCSYDDSGLGMYLPVLESEHCYLEKALEKLEAFTDCSHWDECRQAIEDIAFPRLPSAKKDSYDIEIKNRVQNTRDKIKTAVSKFKTTYFVQSYAEISQTVAELAPVAKALVELCKDYRNLWMQRKREKCYFDFSDLEHYCLDLLEFPEVSTGLKNEFAEVFVDEYQDVNRVQEAVLNAVSGDDNRFMVGDIKQSIYRFRMAEPGLFNEKFRSYGLEQGGHRIDLMDNFRSQKNIINCVNYVFRRLMIGSQLEVNYDKAAELHAGNTTLDELPVELMILDKSFIENDEMIEALNNGVDPDVIAEMQNMEKEAIVIADRIKHLKAQGKDYSEICILLRSAKNNAMVVKSVLQRAGIPCITDGQGDFFETPEIEIAVSLLKIIDNPLQDIEMAAVLHSPIVGMSLSDLAELRMLAPNLYLYEAMKLSADSRVISFLNKLSAYGNPTEIMGMKEFCHKVFTESGLFATMTAQPGGRQRRDNLLELVAVAAEYDQSAYKGLYRFISYLEWLRLMGKRAPRQVAVGNAVTVMTIHRSKGLEFPVVFIAGLEKQFNKMDLNKDFLYHRELGLGLRAVEPDKRIKYRSIGFNAIAIKKDWELKAEELRMLYVAMTRAKERLILIGAVDSMDGVYNKTAVAQGVKEWQLPIIMIKKSVNYLDWLVMALAAHGDCKDLRLEDNLECNFRIRNDISSWLVDVIVSLPMEVYDDFDNSLVEGGLTVSDKIEQTEVSNQVAAALGWQYKNKDICTWPIKWSATALNNLKNQNINSWKKTENNDSLESQTSQIGTNSGADHDLSWYADLGTCVHYLLEKADLDVVSCDENAVPHLAELLSEYEEADDIKASVNLQNVAGFFTSAVGRQLLEAHKAGKNLMREADFTLAISIAEFAEIFFDKKTIGEKEIAEFAEVCSLDYRVNAKEKVFFQGVIDLCFEGENGWILLDYKSGYNNNLTDADVKTKYGSQLHLYQMALKKITKKPVEKKYIYFTANNRLTAVE